MPGVIQLKTAEQKTEILEYLISGWYPANSTESQRRTLRRKCIHLRYIEDVLYFVKPDNSKRIVVFSYQTEYIQQILREQHSQQDHAGIEALKSQISEQYYGLPSQAITDFVNACPGCRRTNPLRTIEEVSLVQITAKYDRYVIDCVDLRSYSRQNDGWCWILNVIDSYTKFLWSYKLKTKSANGVVASLKRCFTEFGVPIAVQSDNGKEFKNRLLRELCFSMRIQVIHGRPRNPRAQGVVERVNQTLKRKLMKCMSHPQTLRWIDFHELAVHGYNCKKHKATKKTPFFLFFGKLGFNRPQPFSEVDEEGNPFSPSSEAESGEEEYPIFDFNGPIPDDSSSVESEEADVNELDPSVHAEVLDHFAGYSERTSRNANSNFRNLSFFINEVVLLKRDFDNNPTTRRRAFEGYYESGEFRVIGLPDNNMVRIEKIGDSNDVRTVHKSRLKK